MPPACRRARRQRTGKLAAHWDPVDVLALVNQLASTWAAVVEAIELLFPRAHQRGFPQ